MRLRLAGRRAGDIKATDYRSHYWRGENSRFSKKVSRLRVSMTLWVAIADVLDASS